LESKASRNTVHGWAFACILTGNYQPGEWMSRETTAFIGAGLELYGPRRPEPPSLNTRAGRMSDSLQGIRSYQWGPNGSDEREVMTTPFSTL
jgi:hypothetical protein